METQNRMKLMSIKKVGHFKKGGQGSRVYSDSGKSVTINALGGGMGAKTGLYLVEAVASRGRYFENGMRKDKLGAKTNAIRSSGSGSGDRHNWDQYKINGRIRKLTPTECERLQGLPDNYTAGISDSARYKACGNAFNADVIAHILFFIPNS